MFWGLSTFVRSFRRRAPTLIGIVVLVAMVVEACHTPYDNIGKRKRETSAGMDERVFMPLCLGNLSNRTVQWGGPVTFVIQSVWFQDTQERCSSQLGTDTAECWLRRTNQLIFRNSELLDQVKSCIISYNFLIRNENYEGSTFPSDEIEEPFDDDLCPDVQDSEFISDFEESLGDFEMDEETQDIVNDLQSVIDVFQEDIICPTCSCRNLSENVGTLEEFDFEETSLECNQCWSTRLGSMARRGAGLTRFFGLTSIRVDRLTAVDNCPGDFIDLDDPIFETSLDANVICLPDSITVRVDRCTLVNLGLDFVNELVIANPNENFTTGTMIDPNCEPELYDNPNFDDVEFSIRHDFAQCGAEIKINHTHISYSYFLRANTDDVLRGPISRFGDFCFAIECTYERKYNISYFIPLKPLIGKTELELDGGVGHFEIEITLYEDDDFTEPFMLEGSEVPTIEVPNYIYVAISILTPVQNIRLVVRRCTASNTNPVNTNPAGSFGLIRERCPNDHLLVVLEESRHDYNFAFPSFYWVDETLDQFLYIICEVRVCDVTSGNCEESECGGDTRRKRERKDWDDSNLSVGPIRLVSKSPACSKNNGGCSHLCVGLENGYRCECREGYLLLEDGRNCIDQSAYKSQEILESSHLSPDDSSSETSFLLDFAVVSLIVFLSVLSISATLRIAWNVHKISSSAKHAEPI